MDAIPEATPVRDPFGQKGNVVEREELGLPVREHVGRHERQLVGGAELAEADAEQIGLAGPLEDGLGRLADRGRSSPRV